MDTFNDGNHLALFIEYVHSVFIFFFFFFVQCRGRNVLALKDPPD